MIQSFRDSPTRLPWVTRESVVGVQRQKVNAPPV